MYTLRMSVHLTLRYEHGGNYMEPKKTFSQRLLSLLAVIIGNSLYALAIKLFLLPAGLVTGGTTGIALTVNHLFGIPVSAFVLVFNIIMLILGYCVLGKKFAATTLASTFIYPAALEIFNRVLGDYTLTEDLLLCTLFSGLLIGGGLGLVIRSGASTGGMDIPPLILQKTLRIPVSVGLYLFDMFILLSQAIFRPIESILYGIFLLLIYTIVLDKMLLMGTSRTEVKVISSKTEEIRDAILTQIDRGVTLLEAESGYLHRKSPVVMSVISNRELPRLQKVLHEIDPECFLVVSRVTEVKGRGFSLNKDYQ